jgi:cyclopropane-fatty-acyl-phospholipid synthase
VSGIRCYLSLRFDDHLVIAGRWRIDGRHYAKTCEAWLRNMDAHPAAITAVLAATYGAPVAALWRAR